MIEVVDANVISELSKPDPHPNVVRWAASVSKLDIAVTSMTIMEVRRGCLRHGDARKRQAYADALVRFRAIWVSEYLLFDLPAAEETARYLVERERMGRRLEVKVDAMIAGVVFRLNNVDGRPARVATRNVGDFLNVPLVNPWDDPPPA